MDARPLLAAFDAAFVINLDSRQDKLRRFRAEMQKVGLSDADVTRWPGVPHESGAAGCAAAHAALAAHAARSGMSRVLVFEDDAEWTRLEPEDAGSMVAEVVAADWDLLYLGYNSHAPLERVGCSLLRARECYATHAYAMSAAMCSRMADAHESGAMGGVIDVWLRNVVQPENRSVGTYPMLFTQTAGMSDIYRRQVNYDFMLKRFFEHTKHFA